MKQRNDKRISTSFSLADLDDLCLVLSSMAHVDRGERLYRVACGLRTKLRTRVALAKLRECSMPTAASAVEYRKCEGV
jgi:hypothetical protein